MNMDRYVLNYTTCLLVIEETLEEFNIFHESKNKKSRTLDVESLSEFYFVFEEKIKDFVCVELKDLKNFSEKYPNIKLYKENLDVDKETLKYLEKNFAIKHLESYLK